MKKMAASLLLCFLSVFCFAYRGDLLSIGLIKYGRDSSFDPPTTFEAIRRRRMPKARLSESAEGAFAQKWWGGDPYPLLWRELGSQIESATSVETAPLFKTNINVSEKELVHFGIIFLAGREDFQGFSSEERKTLSNWVNLGGGLLVIVNAEAGSSSVFDREIREEIREIFPTKDLEKIPAKDALFRSFYLIRGMGGVLQRSRSLEGIKIGERYGVIYSPNDLLGALVRDREGNYLFRCYPGGEDQRKESFKLVLNLFLYGLTGTYKSDVIHLPFIEEKLKRSP